MIFVTGCQSNTSKYAVKDGKVSVLLKNLNIQFSFCLAIVDLGYIKTINAYCSI